MSESLASLRHQIAQIEQKIETLTQQMSKSQQSAALRTVTGDAFRAASSIKQSHDIKRDIDECKSRIEQLHEKSKEISNQLINLDAKLTTRKHQYDADQAKLAQHYEADIKEIEREKDRLQG